MKPDDDPIRMNPDALYREETFTDLAVGVIKRLTPVTRTGEPDPSRPVLYRGETQILLGASPLPIAFELDAKSLAEAAEQFAEAARRAAEETVRQLEELRREMQSQILVPGQGGLGGGVPGGLGGGLPGGLPGGGKIKLP
ncbi:MAG: hypothetical protein KatS3mg124_2327 [Porticoccaceae bacterium]|nr:MAG: hypothetical protein KatS3mg124_2327 [Porticoccaceae bacterium]